jgi:hypothetical protein
VKLNFILGCLLTDLVGHQVRFVADNDISYGSGQFAASMMHLGKVSFKTCYQSAHIPASYVIKLASKDYANDTMPGSFCEALDHWFLCEILSAIGNHTVA